MVCFDAKAERDVVFVQDFTSFVFQVSPESAATQLTQIWWRIGFSPRHSQLRYLMLLSNDTTKSSESTSTSVADCYPSAKLRASTFHGHNMIKAMTHQGLAFFQLRMPKRGEYDRIHTFRSVFSAYAVVRMLTIL